MKLYKMRHFGSYRQDCWTRMRIIHPARYWGPGSFEFAADFPDGTRDIDLLLTLWDG